MLGSEPENEGSMKGEGHEGQWSRLPLLLSTQPGQPQSGDAVSCGLHRWQPRCGGAWRSSLLSGSVGAACKPGVVQIHLCLTDTQLLWVSIELKVTSCAQEIQRLQRENARSLRSLSISSDLAVHVESSRERPGQSVHA